MLPTLAVANPAHTTPLSPTPIVALLPTPYPPSPGLPLLPDTDRQNVLLGEPVTAPTVSIAPPHRTSCPHTVRGPSDFGYSAVSDNNGTNSTASLELTDLLSVATACCSIPER